MLETFLMSSALDVQNEKQFCSALAEKQKKTRTF
jgi:hypothetical protein